MAQRPLLLVLMGPSGCGKSTLALSLARQTAGDMIEGDDYHSMEARAKMAGGTPLDDSDRESWIDRLTQTVRKSDNSLAWLACSALTPYVQTRLRKESGRDIKFILLDVPASVLRDRMNDRPDHFMPSSLLQSQLDALHTPYDVIRINADQPLAKVRADVLTAIGLASNDQAD